MILGYIGILVYLANREAARGETEPLVRGLLSALPAGMLLLAISLLMTALAEPLMTTRTAAAMQDLPEITVSPLAAVLYLLLSVAGAAASVAVLRYRSARVFVQRHVVGRRKAKTETSATQIERYNPDSIVHTTAVILALFVALALLYSFILSGGIEGIATDIAASSTEGFGASQLNDLLFNAALFVALSLLGVGLYIRRNLPETLERLKLRWPNWADWRSGLLVGFGMFIVQVIIGFIWAILTTPELFEQQTQASQAIFESFSGSLFAGFMLAATAAIGEEILFRGALQPVFGIWLTSILFAILHTQYTLTPAVLIIFLVSLAFGWVRNRYSTSAAIIAHFIYNLIPFLLIV